MAAYVRFWHKANITIAANNVRFWGSPMSAFDP
jgi:hypothetical protein